MPTQSDRSGPLGNWLNILDAMNASVAHTLKVVEDRDAEPSLDATNSAFPGDREFRAGLDSTIRGLEQRLEAAKTLADQIEDMLDRDEQEVRTWRSAVDAARQRLAAPRQL